MSKDSAESLSLDALGIKYSCGCQFIFVKGNYYPQIYFCKEHEDRVNKFGWI